MGPWWPLFEAGLLDSSHGLRKERVGASDSQSSVPKPHPPREVNTCPTCIGKQAICAPSPNSSAREWLHPRYKDTSSEYNTHGPDGSLGFQLCYLLKETQAGPAHSADLTAKEDQQSSGHR